MKQMLKMTGRPPSKIFGQTLRPTGTFLAGIAFKLGKRVNLAIEDRFTIIKDDLLDGQQCQDPCSMVMLLTLITIPIIMLLLD